MGSASIDDLSRETVVSELKGNSELAFVDVWGPQCVPCVALAPVYEELAAKHGERARFFKLEAPKNRMACVDLKVMSLPTFLFFEKGEEVDRLSGDVDSTQLQEWIEKSISLERR